MRIDAVMRISGWKIMSMNFERVVRAGVWICCIRAFVVVSIVM